MATVEKVNQLRKNVNEIRNLFNEKIPKWKAEPGHYDKTKWGFVEGDNGGWYRGQTLTIHFGAWCGTYGNSSVYKQIELDGDIFRQHLLSYLNRNKKEIMMSIAESIEDEARSLVEEAKKELNEKIGELDELKTN